MKLNLAANLITSNQSFIEADFSEEIILSGYVHEGLLGGVVQELDDFCNLTLVDSLVKGDLSRYWFDSSDGVIYLLTEEFSPTPIAFGVTVEIGIEKPEAVIGFSQGGFNFASIEYAEILGRRYPSGDITDNNGFYAVNGVSASAIGSIATVKATIDVDFSPIVAVRMFEADELICVIDSIVYHGKNYLPASSKYRPEPFQATLNFNTQKISLFDPLP